MKMFVQCYASVIFSSHSMYSHWLLRYWSTHNIKSHENLLPFNNNTSSINIWKIRNDSTWRS